MGKERLLTTLFKSITSEEIEILLKCDVQILNEQVVQKQIGCQQNQRSIMLAGQARF